VLLPAELRKIHAEHIGVEYRHAGILRKSFLELRRQEGIYFNGHHLADAFRQQAGHRPAPRADFDYHVIRAQGESIENPLSIARVGEKMLAEFGA
jgi:hypothetical protein